MSGGIEALQLKEEDVVKLLAAAVHLGASNVDFQMESYVYKRKADGEEKCFKTLLLVVKKDSVSIVVVHDEMCVLLEVLLRSRGLCHGLSHCILG